MTDPFRALGLEPAPGRADDDVRGAWRRVAAATHPDRADGGDPAAFAAAAAAYTELRTEAGRGEALADLFTMRPTRDARPPGRRRAPSRRVLAYRVSHGRPFILAIRIAAALAGGAVAVLVAGWQPASLAIITGALTWLVLTGRADLTGPP